MGVQRLAVLHPAPHRKKDGVPKDHLAAEVFTSEFMRDLVGLPLCGLHSHTPASVRDLQDRKVPFTGEAMRQAYTKCADALPYKYDLIREAAEREAQKSNRGVITTDNIKRQIVKYRDAATKGIPVIGKIQRAFQDKKTGDIKVLLEFDESKNDRLHSLYTSLIHDKGALPSISLSTVEDKVSGVFWPVEVSVTTLPLRPGCDIYPANVTEQYLHDHPIFNMATPDAVQSAEEIATAAADTRVPQPRKSNGQFAKAEFLTAEEWNEFHSTLTPEQKARFERHEQAHDQLLEEVKSMAPAPQVIIPPELDTKLKTLEQELNTTKERAATDQQYIKTFHEAMMGLASEQTGVLRGTDLNSVRAGLENPATAPAMMGLVMGSAASQLKNSVEYEARQSRSESIPKPSSYTYVPPSARKRQAVEEPSTALPPANQSALQTASYNSQPAADSFQGLPANIRGYYERLYSTVGSIERAGL